MDDLDALLADLQNTTAHLQNHRENTRFSNSPGSPKPTFNNSYSYQDDSAPVYQNQKMMREMTVTTKTNYHHVPGSGGGSPTPINHNLSELDNLLEDLNTARYPPPPPPIQNQQNYPQHYESRVPTSPSLNGPNGRYSGGSEPRPSVESLLDELQSAVPTSPSNRRGANRTPERYAVNTVTTTTVTYPQHQPIGRHSPVPSQAASSATKELDDLMASLSDFKLNAAGPPQHVPQTTDSLYAKPNKPKSSAPSQSQTRAQTQTRARTPDNAQIVDNQLDSMLGTLQSDMSKQGVNTAQKGCCAACSKPIVGQVVTALAKTWHPEHFVCAHCNQELGTKNFFERDGRPYCEPDYHNLFSPRCAYCNGPILDKCVSALDKTWHPEHFFCAQCGGQFGEDGFHEKDGKPYCRNDYFQMFAPKCGGCNRPIMENYISALNSQWHPDCFVCRDCRTPFNGGSFFDHDGQPYCETHYHAKRGSLCAGCQKPITGRCITAMFRKFHPEHFVCSFCLKQLNKGTFKEQNDKPYCHPCFEKLFG